MDVVRAAHEAVLECRSFLVNLGAVGLLMVMGRGQLFYPSLSISATNWMFLKHKLLHHLRGGMCLVLHHRGLGF